MGKLICLTDQQGKPVYFDPADLMDQIFSAGLISMEGPSKSAAMHLARKVQQVRDLQKRGDSNRVKAEKALDKLIWQFIQTVQAL